MTSPPPPTKEPPGGGGDSAGSATNTSIQLAEARNTLEVITSLTQKLQEQLDSLEASQNGDVV